MIQLPLEPARGRRLLSLAEKVVAMRGLGGDNCGTGAGGFQPGNTCAKGSLSTEQVDALQNYVAGSEELNNALRQGQNVSPFDKKHDIVGHLDRAIAAQRPLPSGTTLYRVVEKNNFNKSEYTDKAFVSTTKSALSLEGMLEDAGLDTDDVVVLRVVTEEDVRGLDVNKHLPRDRNFFVTQKEVLLERGLTFTYVGPAKDIIEGVPSYTVRVENKKLRSAGGPGSGHFGHAGRPGQIGGSVPGDSSSGDVEREVTNQRERFERQDNPLAHPTVLLGVRDSQSLRRYVGAYGEEHRAAPRPDDVKKGQDRECYKNASLLVMTRPDLTYAEGYAKHAKTGDITFLHAWAVTADGTVVDPTWSEPENARYFGVRYERKAYLKYLYKAKIYGVLGSTDENAKRATETGVPELRGGAR